MHTLLMSPNAPRAWVGCLACYNNGRLVGDWYDAEDTGDLHIDQVHEAGGYNGHCDGEEMWCLDTENLPGGEMDPTTAASWGERYEELADDSQWPAFLAYFEAFGRGEAPDVSAFREAYQGRWNDFEDFVYHYAEETGLQCDWPEEAVLHFSWSSYSETLEQDYLVEDAPGGVFVFYAHG